MYYLQSRYYDPEVCRFINADEFASTGQGFIGFNMFAYCNNNPVNCVDSRGLDAIWIHEADSAAEFGHSGLLVEDADSGNWSYFYWGPKDEETSPLILASIGAPANVVFVKVEVGDSNLYSKEELVAILKNSDDDFVRSRAELVTDSFYFEGDFSGTFDYLNGLVDSKNSRYHLLLNNCVQNVWTALGKSKLWFSFMDCPVIPDMAYSKVLFYSGEFDECRSFVVRQLCK